MVSILDRFRPELKTAIKENFSEFTQIQNQAMPYVLDGKNTLIIAPTGSGKTESAFLPVLNGMLGVDPDLSRDSEPKTLDAPHGTGQKTEDSSHDSRQKTEDGGIVALYIAPLRALNRDMFSRMQSWCDSLGISVSVRHGDTTQSERARQRIKPPKLLITTPETLQAILPAKVMRKHLASVKYVIIDEIHELISDKRGVQLSVGLERLREVCGRFQTIGISATVGSPDIVAGYFGLDNIVVDKSLKSLEILVEHPPNITKRVSELTGDKSTLVFTNTRVATELLTKQLRAVSDVGIHHSSLSKEERIDAEGKLKQGELKTLICTSSMELGIDVGDIEQVIQVSSPRQVARLLQRVGRSGHSSKKTSKGIVLAGDFDDVIEAGIVSADALAGNIEQTDYYKESLDVLSQQIVGLVLDFGDIRLNDAYRIIKRAYPYRKLRIEQFDSVIDTLKRLRLIGWDEDMISRRRKSLMHYYENLSTIPTYTRYMVIDMASNRPVGVLDEEYIVDCHVNSIFILKGEAWRIVDFRDKRVIVVPVSELGAETPVWVGEDLPVPFDVAREVGRARQMISEAVDRKKTDLEISKMLSLPIDQKGISFLVRTITRQKKQGVVPDDKTITIERFIGDYHQIIINTCFGTKVNDTISRVLASLLSSRYGEGVGVKVDPYRIVLTAMHLEEDVVAEELMSLEEHTIEHILEKVISSTNLFRFSFLHVGKRFGVFRQDTNFREINLSRVIDSYSGSPVYFEALSELYKKFFDIKNAKKALSMIRSGEIEVSTQSFTTLSQFGLEQFKDAIAAETPERAIIETIKNRLSKRKVNLVCLNCGEVMRNRTIDTLEYPISCPVCESWMIASMGNTQEDLSKIVRKNKRREALSAEERKFLNRARKSAGLIHSFEKQALMALNAKGVGPRTSERILEMNLTDDEFFKEILSAEREFVRTSKFWKK